MSVFKTWTTILIKVLRNLCSQERRFLERELLKTLRKVMESQRYRHVLCVGNDPGNPTSLTCCVNSHKEFYSEHEEPKTKSVPMFRLNSQILNSNFIQKCWKLLESPFRELIDSTWNWIVSFVWINSYSIDDCKRLINLSVANANSAEVLINSALGEQFAERSVAKPSCFVQNLLTFLINREYVDVCQMQKNVEELIDGWNNWTELRPDSLCTIFFVQLANWIGKCIWEFKAVTQLVTNSRPTICMFYSDRVDLHIRRLGDRHVTKSNIRLF